MMQIRAIAMLCVTSAIIADPKAMLDEPSPSSCPIASLSHGVSMATKFNSGSV